MSTTATQTHTAEPATELASLSLTGSNKAPEPAPTQAKADGSDRTLPAGPLERTGALDGYKQRDETPVIGTTFYDLDIAAVLEQDNADELLRELAIIISERNVVFLRNQAGELRFDQLKKIANKLGTLTGRPAESGLHIHPTIYQPDLEISGISDKLLKNSHTTSSVPTKSNGKPFASAKWHADITFEPVPSDFALLQVHELPSDGGGDTLWASAYEAYDRLTPAYEKFVEGLHAVHDGNGFHLQAKARGIEVYTDKRGHPLNVGGDLTAVHPVVRTNPVTGWKGLFVNRTFTKRIVELSPDESDQVLSYLFRLVTDNHDLQVRFRWESNDVAIWSNTSSFHNVTLDYETPRNGNRAVSLGERPYLDPNSKSRREARGLSQ